MEKLTGKVPSLREEQDVAAVRESVARTLAGAVAEDRLAGYLQAMTPHYLRTTPVDRIVEHVRTVHTLTLGEVSTTAVYDPQTRITGYTVYTFDNITPGLFSKIAGVLAAKGLQILSAQITTHQDGVVVDRFEVLDYDYEGEPPRTRLADVGATIRHVLLGQRTVENLFAHGSRIGPRYHLPPATHQEPTQVQIDNDTSDRFTIVEVFANDRQGLLYVIARTLFELGLSVSLAKIATSLDQVLDVFYVTDVSGTKVTDDSRLGHIRQRLFQAIEAYDMARPAARVG
jgi:[protein-PII] uridylyltransferase